MKRIAGPVRFGLLACWLLLVCYKIGFFEPYTTWWQVSELTVVAGPEEAWIFMVVERLTYNPTPGPVSVRYVARERFLQIVAIGLDGVKRNVRVSPIQVWEFRNLAEFAENNQRGEPPKTEAERMLLDSWTANLSPADLHVLQEPGEWTRIYHSFRGFHPNMIDEFEWNGKSFKFGVVKEGDWSTFKLSCRGERPWEAELVTYRSKVEPTRPSKKSGPHDQPRPGKDVPVEAARIDK